MSDWEMPFGKHRGKRLAEVPTSYLSWMLDNVDFHNDDFREAVENEYESRYRSHRQNSPPPPPTNGKAADTSRIVDAVKRRVILRYHPDRGGSATELAAALATLELIVELAE